MGERRAAEFCHNLDPTSVSTLVLLGWAGGLIPSLPAGSLVCASEALHQDQPPIACQTLVLPNTCTAPILTVSRALVTPQEKLSARATGAVAVEMEAYPLAQWAQLHAIPFIHVRVILDAWDDALPQIAPGLASAFNPLVFLSDIWRLFRRIRSVDPILANLARDVVEAFYSPRGLSS
jgi:hypothetical protein